MLMWSRLPAHELDESIRGSIMFGSYPMIFDLYFRAPRIVNP